MGSSTAFSVFCRQASDEEGGTTMSVIHLLPDAVANQIAAGEVIQRPASVIKELMENSIDAGATEVKVLVQDAGRTQIQVIDNGCGMTETDARLAFERHATSKISSAHDLYSLTTMGFRGEALASIAAVAQVELLTRTEAEELGVKIVIEGSEVTAQEPCATPRGSRFCVKNLFFNVPARRRFLKSDVAEMRHVNSEFLRVALAHPGVGMSLAANGVALYNLPAGNIKQRVAGVAGLAMAKRLLPIECSTSLVKICGFVGTPETAKKSGGDQYFFANDRYMRSAYFNKAVVDAYKAIIPPDTLPAYYIYISVDPQSLDVNVHPQKTEIKFDDDQAIWKILNATVRACLNDNNILPQIDFDRGERIDIPPFDLQAADSYNPFAVERAQAAQFASSFGGGGDGSAARPWQTLYDAALGSSASAGLAPLVGPGVAGGEPLLVSAGPEPEACGRPTQHRGRYVVVPTTAGLAVIDQRRAHERVLYDRLRETMAHAAVECQRLLFPEVVAMGADDLCVLAELTHELAQAGIETVVDAEAGTITISTIPALVDVASVRSLVETLAYDCRAGQVDVRGDVGDVVARKLAAQGAMPYGRTLSDDEMADLYAKLMASADRQTTPDGRPAMRVLADADLEALFRY